MWESPVATGEFATGLGANNHKQNTSDKESQDEQHDSADLESGAKNAMATPLATPTPKPKAVGAARPPKISAKMLDQMIFTALEEMFIQDSAVATSSKPAPTDIEVVMTWIADEFEEGELVDVLMHFRERLNDAKLAMAMARLYVRKSFILRMANMLY